MAEAIPKINPRKVNRMTVPSFWSAQYPNNKGRTIMTVVEVTLDAKSTAFA